MIHSDWHIHSEYSYDASNPLETIAQNAQAQGLCRVGITDHANFNDEKFLSDLHRSVAGVKEAQKKYPFMVLGVELTPIEKPEFDYIAKPVCAKAMCRPCRILLLISSWLPARRS